MQGCNKCKIVSSILLLLAGLAFLLVDLNVWTFWGVSWWSVAFLLVGIGSLAKCCCSDCQVCDMPKKRK